MPIVVSPRAALRAARSVDAAKVKAERQLDGEALGKALHDERLAARYLSASAEPRIPARDLAESVCDLFEEIADYRPPRRTSVARPLSLLAHGGAVDLARRGTLSLRHRARRIVPRRA